MSIADKVAEKEEIALLMDSRASVYGLLARLYRVEVDKPLLEEMKKMKFPTATGNKSADEGYRLLHAYINKTWADSITELAIDYVETFIGNGVNGYSAAYPFESVHTSERRLLMQEARDDVLATYRENGLKKGQWSEGEDHIALEMEFMQIMTTRCAEYLRKDQDDAVAENLVKQNDFVGNHLSNWVPMLTSDMTKYAKTDFYKGLAKLTRGFIETEVDLLSEVTE